MPTPSAPPPPASVVTERLALIANRQRLIAAIRNSDREIRALMAQSRRQLAESYRLLGS